MDFFQKAIILLICFAACAPEFEAQSLPNSYFDNPYLDTCQYDTTGQTTYNRISDWAVFQTLDSTRWGPKDSNCIPVDYVANQAYIRMDSTNPAYPIYLDSEMDTTNMVYLPHDGLYKITAQINGGAGLQLMEGLGCKEGMCTGIQIGIEVPDSAGTGTNIRWYQSRGHESNGNWFFEMCIPSEKFVNGNHIKRAWFKFTDSTSNAGTSINPSYVQIEDMRYYMELIPEIHAGWTGSNYEYLMQSWGDTCWMCPNKLLQHTDTTYPSPTNKSYIDIYPSPNTTTQEQVDVIVGWDAFLTGQPFTEMRGGQVVGDTLRHSFNLINNGGTVCTYGIVELVFEDDNAYTHRAGRVDFGPRNSCFLFGKGGSMNIADGVVLDYGKPGIGMLALRTGGEINIGRNAELVIRNTMIMGEYQEETEPAQFRIVLERGSKLTFAPGSRLTNGLSKFPEQTYLEVYMKGGELNDNNLSEADRSLIRRIYETPSDELADNLEVYGNPFEEALSFSLTANAGDKIVSTLFALDGKLLHKRMYNAKEGINLFEIPAGELASGAYILKIATAEGMVTKKVIKR